MKVVVQRVESSSVLVDDKIVGQINKGLMILVGFTYGDNIDTIKYIVNKIVNLRIFDDENGVMNLSVNDIKGEILSVSQFTLYATFGGRRPSFTKALNYNSAKELYDIFNEELRKNDINVETGIFGEDMKVNFTNDGPVTIIIDSKVDL